MKKHFFLGALFLFALNSDCIAQQDYEKLNRDRNLFNSRNQAASEKLAFTTDSIPIIKDFGKKKNSKPFIILFPLKARKSEYSFQLSPSDMTGTRKDGDSHIKTVNLTERGFEVTYDPTGKTGPVEDFIIVKTKNGDIYLKLKGSLIESKKKTEETTHDEQ